MWVVGKCANEPNRFSVEGGWIFAAQGVVNSSSIHFFRNARVIDLVGKLIEGHDSSDITDRSSQHYRPNLDGNVLPRTGIC